MGQKTLVFTVVFRDLYCYLPIQYIKQITKNYCKAKMNHKRTSQRYCFSNYSQSFPNLHNTPLISIDFKQFFLKKSLFNPPEELAESFASRRHIAAADVPIIEVTHYSKRWLLLQAPRFSRNFFRRLNSGHLGNPYQQLLKIFKSFAALAKIYGYFRPTVGMIFMENKTIRVWINEDIFSGVRMNSLSQGLAGEQQFVIAFLAMVQGEMMQWERVNNIYSIQETVKLLDWRSKLNRGSASAVKASKQVFCHPSQSKVSFDPNELCESRKLKTCLSAQEFEVNQSCSFFQTQLSSSVTIKDQEHKTLIKMANQKKKFGLLFDSKEMKNSFNDGHQVKGVDFTNEARRTKKKFNLTSTSSTLQRFSEKWRSTAGKKTKKNIQIPQSNYTQYYQPQHPQKQQPVSIQHEFEGLFGEEGGFQFQLGMEGNKQQLQKIAQEIEEVLIW